MHEMEGLVEVLRRTAEAEVTCLLKVYGNEITGSLRAQSRVDVSVIAKLFGGGGHKFAAGFSTTQSRESVLATIKHHLATTT